MSGMASLSIRRIDDETYRLLQEKAAANGVSMEEQVRRILRQAVSPPERLGSLAIELFGAEAGVELELPAREVAEPPRFDQADGDR